MFNFVPLEPVDYLVIGHIVEDQTSEGARLGGTVAYAALTARALGLRVGVVTACCPQTDLSALAGIPVMSAPSAYTTTFENIYMEGGRRQFIHHQAELINLESVPETWRHASIIHIGPVAQEVDALLPASFSPTLLGLTPQGWMRSWDGYGRVVRKAWENAEQALGSAGGVVFSKEDVGNDEEQIEFMAAHTRILAVTEGPAGARLYWNGDQRRFRAPVMNEVDATGAGDIFAAAFFIRLSNTRDPWEAARFATKLSACSVGRTALDGIPTGGEIQNCMVEVF